MEGQEKSDAGGASAWVMGALALSALLASLGTSIANIALPALAEVFSAPFAEVQAVVVAYLATLTVFVVFCRAAGRSARAQARAACLRARRLCGRIALVRGCAEPLVPGRARGLQGVGAAILMTLAMALMREVASEARLGRAMGLLGTISALGTALGPSLGGLLLPVTGWRGIFAVQVPLALLALLLAGLFVPNTAPKTKIKGPSLLSMLDRRLAPNLAVNFLVAAVMMTTLVVGPFFLGMGLGLKPGMVGLVMTVGPAISIVSGVPAGGWWMRREAAGCWFWACACSAPGRFFSPGCRPCRRGRLCRRHCRADARLPAFSGGQQHAGVGRCRQRPAWHGVRPSQPVAQCRADCRGFAHGAVFALGVGRADIAGASAVAIADGMRLTFLVAAGAMAVAMAVHVAARKRAVECTGAMSAKNAKSPDKPGISISTNRHRLIRPRAWP